MEAPKAVVALAVAGKCCCLFVCFLITICFILFMGWPANSVTLYPSLWGGMTNGEKLCVSFPLLFLHIECASSLIFVPFKTLYRDTDLDGLPMIRGSKQLELLPLWMVGHMTWYCSTKSTHLLTLRIYNAWVDIG
jgi:hypothetical protein